MTYGIEIRNPNGIISIDGNFKNYQVVSNFTITDPNAFISIPAYRPRALLFMRPFSYGVKVVWESEFNYLLDNHIQTGGITGYDRWRLPVGNYVLALPISSGTSGESHGIRIWNGSSNVVFDSGKKIINIDSMVMKTYTAPSVSAASTWSQVISLPSYPSGLRYFLFNPLDVLASYDAYYYDPGDGSPGIFYYYILTLAFTFNNENQVTWTIDGWQGASANSAYGMGLENTSIPLVSAYITL